MHQHSRNIAPSVWLRLDVLAASLSINLLSLALPIVILQIYDRILANTALDTFSLLMVGLCVVVCVEAGLRIARGFVMAWLGSSFEHKLGTEAFERLLQTDITRFESLPPGSYLDRLQGVESLRDFHSGPAATVLIDLPFVFVYLGLIWVIAGWLVAVPAGLLVVFAAAALIVGRALRRALEDRAAMDDRRYDFLMETLAGIHTVKSMAMEPVMTRRYERLQAQSADSVWRLGRLSSFGQGLSTVFGQIAMATVVGGGALLAIDGHLTIGAVAASTLLTGRALQPVLRGMSLWNQYQMVRLARRRIDEIRSLPSEFADREALRGVASPSIHLEAVSFGYREDSYLFDAVSLDVAPGEAIGITGDNGVGKSTFLSLIMGLVAPVHGRVLIDGRDVNRIDPAELRAAIGFMPQTGTLFRGSLLDNLTLFRGGEAVDRAIDLASLLGLDEVITRMPLGLNTQMGESAVEAASDGIRQRILMVRALVNDPSIILFDSANAALDQHSDRLLTQLLRSFKGQKTMVISTHRPSLLGMCDRCFRIAEGRLIEIPVPGARQMIAPTGSFEGSADGRTDAVRAAPLLVT